MILLKIKKRGHFQTLATGVPELKTWLGTQRVKARHEAVSFEAAEWSERLTSRRVGWLGAAAVGSIPALVTFFSFSSLLLLLLFLSSLSKPIFSFLLDIISILALFSCLSPFSSAGSSWLLSLSRFFPFFLPLANPHRPCQSEPLP